MRDRLGECNQNSCLTLPLGHPWDPGPRAQLLPCGGDICEPVPRRQWTAYVCWVRSCCCRQVVTALPATLPPQAAAGGSSDETS